MWAARPEDAIANDGVCFSHKLHSLLRLGSEHRHRHRHRHCCSHHQQQQKQQQQPPFCPNLPPAASDLSSLLDVSLQKQPPGPHALHRHQLQLQLRLPPFPARSPSPSRLLRSPARSTRSPPSPSPSPSPSPTRPRPRPPSPTRPAARSRHRSPSPQPLAPSSPPRCAPVFQGALGHSQRASQHRDPREAPRPDISSYRSSGNPILVLRDRSDHHHNRIECSSPANSPSKSKGLTVPGSKHHRHYGEKENLPDRCSPYTTWKEENVAPVPQGLIKETDTKLLERLVKQGVESYIKGLKNPSDSYKDFKPIKPSPIVSGGSLYHYKRSNLGKQDLEAWKKKQQERKDSKSSYNLAFGRSKSIRSTYSHQDSSDLMASPNDDLERLKPKRSGNFLKSVRGKMNARREVMNAIYSYRVNSQARAQLERRACEFEREKRERMQLKVDFGNQAMIKKRGRRRGRIIHELPLNR